VTQVKRDRPRSTSRRVVATTAALVVAAVAVPAVGATTLMDQNPEPATEARAERAAARAESERLRVAAELRRAEHERAEKERVARERAAREHAAKEQQRRDQFLFAVAAHQAAQRAELERIAAERAAEAERRAAARASRRGGGGAPGLAGLRNCESGGNYGAVNPSGTYRGAYQFSRSTWNSVASKSFPHLVGVDPAAAAPADQDAMAQALYASSGSSPWPVCGRHL
jgi:hypothetical protein